MLGNSICSEVSREQDPFRTWLWLGPVSDGLELRRVQQARGVDPEDWPRPGEDPQVVERESFPDLDTAVVELARRGVDTDSFDALWNTSNPF
jgi:hypothetical protein